MDRKPERWPWKSVKLIADCFRKISLFYLIGPGRWGSADPWLGIPVQWGDISGVAAIIEVQSDKIRADPSQGTHFFQNITSLGIPYLTLTENRHKESGRKDDYLHWQWLEEQPLVKKGKFVRHIRLNKPFILKCDGTKSESVLFQMERPCDMVCTIEGKEIWNQRSSLTGGC